MASSILESTDKHLPDEAERADAVWTLLGRARQVEVSEDFAPRTVVAACVMEQDGTPACRDSTLIVFPAWVRRCWIPTAAAAACAALLLVWQGFNDGVEPGAVANQPGAQDLRVDETEIPIQVEPWEWELQELDLLNQMVAVNDPAKLSNEELAYLLF